MIHAAPLAPPATLTPLPIAMHEILGVPITRAPDGVLDALRLVVAARQDGEREARISALVEQLNVSKIPGQVEHHSASNLTVVSLHRRLRDPSRPLGTIEQRGEVLDALLDVERFPGDPDGDRDRARAAVLLAGQEGFMNGAAWLRRCLSQQRLVDRTGWASSKVDRLRRHLDDEHRLVRGLNMAVIDANRILQYLMDQPKPQLDTSVIPALIEALERVLVGGRRRPLYEWRVANFTWMTVNVAGERERFDVVNELWQAARRWREMWSAEPFNRWIEDALHTPWLGLKHTGISLLTPAQLRERMQHLRPPAA